MFAIRNFAIFAVCSLELFAIRVWKANMHKLHEYQIDSITKSLFGKYFEFYELFLNFIFISLGSILLGIFYNCEVALTSHICFSIRLVFYQHLNSHITYPDSPHEPSNHTQWEISALALVSSS